MNEGTRTAAVRRQELAAYWYAQARRMADRSAAAAPYNGDLIEAAAYMQQHARSHANVAMSILND